MSADKESGAPSSATASVADHSRPLPFPVVGVGASAGGLEAVIALLRSLPDDPGLAFGVVIHIARDRPSSMTEILSRVTPLPVQEATEGMIVERDHVYVIPPNMEMTMVQGTLRLHPRDPGRGRFNVVDTFLVSLAQDQGSNAIGAVLSGADGDGALGLQHIKQASGITFAQDETAKVPGMPRSSIATGAVDFVLPPDAIAAELVRLARQPRPEIPAEPKGPPWPRGGRT